MIIFVVTTKLMRVQSLLSKHEKSHDMRKTMCIVENKGADQLRSNCEADQHLCFRYTDSTIPFLHIAKISSFQLSSVTVQAGRKRRRLVFSLGCSFFHDIDQGPIVQN